ncbi:MAG: serine/threonine-protein kinase [Solirubrobacteraceae bacterium]
MPHAQPPPHAAPAGELILDRYRLVRRIGAGGMGVVYLALDEHLQREVAVKRIAIEFDPDGRGEREAIAAARLSHSGIVSLYESGRDEQAVYLVSELVRGRTLAQLIGSGELSDRDVVKVGVTLCDALEHAHARGVIHRDVKPSNVICPDSPEEGGGVAKLTDFGIALMADGDVLTRTGDIMGTLAYMAPEQACGTGVTGAADVYALGLVLYEGLAGVNPIRAGNPAATARRVGTRLPALARVRRDLPGGLCRAIDAAVLPEPEQRAVLGLLRLALMHAVERVDDEAGPIATDACVAQTARMRTDRRPRPPQPGMAPAPAQELVEPAPPRWRLGMRMPGAAAAALLAGGALEWLGPQPPVGPVGGAATTALAVLVLPRLGWLAMVAALLAWLAMTAPGVALLILFAAVPVVLLLPRQGVAWSLPATAPLLGVVGLAGAWPALAGQAGRWSARAALGALGGLWLVLAEALTSARLLTGQPRDVLAVGSWEGSALDAARDALAPLLSGGTLAIAALWALAAVLLPLLVRGRSAALDLVGVVGWAATLAACTQALSQALVLDASRGLVAGALAAGVVALAARAARGRA